MTSGATKEAKEDISRPHPQTADLICHGAAGLRNRENTVGIIEYRTVYAKAADRCSSDSTSNVRESLRFAQAPNNIRLLGDWQHHNHTNRARE